MKWTGRLYASVPRSTWKIERGVWTLNHQHDEAQVTELNNHLLGRHGEEIASRNAPGDANEDLANEAAVDEAIEDVVDGIESEEEGGLEEECFDGRFVIRE